MTQRKAVHEKDPAVAGMSLEEICSKYVARFGDMGALYGSIGGVMIETASGGSGIAETDGLAAVTSEDEIPDAPVAGAVDTVAAGEVAEGAEARAEFLRIDFPRDSKL